jgi:uncharacterized protein YecT (DUF1311 family)
MRLASATALLVLTSAASPALALDCTKAATPTEKTICAQPALKALDDAMGTAYGALSQRIAPDMKPALLTSQRNFIKGREYCGDDETYALTCIGERTLERLRFLSGGIAPGALVGPLPALEPFLVQQAGDTAKGLRTVDHAVTLFSQPAGRGEEAFNAALRAMASEAVLGPDADMKELGGEVPWESMVSSRITLLTPSIVSAEIETYDYSGGAHGNGGVSSVSFRRDTGQEVSVPTLLGDAGLAALFPLCRRQILDVKTEREPGYDPAQDSNYSDDAVRDGLKEPSLWRLEPGKATVTYNSYAVASYAEGRFECEFPAELLAALTGGSLDLR